ncbi:MAG TPA: M1 family aminopeptidase [Polyangiaceae bacterium]|nr:M1 family aminopeptidase [Polyangiaceae bacterium]
MPNQRLHDRCGCGATHSGEQAAFARPFAFAGTPRNFERDRPFLVEHIAAQIELDPPKKAIGASATIKVRRVDAEAEEIDLDAVGFTLSSIKVDGKTVDHRYDGRALTVPIAKNVQNATITVAYRATPRRGLYFLEPDEHYPERPHQVWSQCQEEDARHWLPCHDKPHVKMQTEITVVAPNGWTVLGNGELAAEAKPKDGPWRFTWKMSEPHASYLLTLVAGEFAVLEETAGPVPLTYLVPKGREEDGKRTFEKTPAMVKHFGTTFGVAYPWNKYAQVVVSDFIFGGMENTTATTLYEYALIDKRAALDVTSDDLIAHELAHQWFGDYVTCRDWSEGWLNEGFATFMEHVWREKDLGHDEYEYGLLADLEGYTSEAAGRYRRPIVCQEYDAPLDLFDRHLYEKGGLVLHILRAELGDTVFWRGIRDYLTRHAKGIVETRDLMRALETASGRSLGRFFEQWVHRPGHPELDVAITWEAGVLSCEVKQHHSTADGVPNAFEFPLWLEIVGKGTAAEKRKLLVSQRTEVFAVPCAERPIYVIVDPELRVLGEVKVKAPGDMLRAQLSLAKSARGRWLAAQALSRVDDPPTIDALGERLRDEREFWGVRAEAASALGKIHASEAFATLAAATKIKHPKARRAVAAALGSFKTPAAFEALKPLALGDESYLVQSEAARSLGKTKQAQAFEVLLDVVDRKSWADVVSVGALDGLAAMREDRAVPHVVARTRYGHPTRTRRAAIMALPKIASDRRAREALEDLLDDKDPYLRVDVVRALGDVGDAKARPALRNKLDTDLDPRVRRRIREVMRDLGGEGKRAAEQLREELEKLRNEHSELKARVAKTEAKLGGGEAKVEKGGKPEKAAKPKRR